jgi:hypothetical protein
VETSERPLPSRDRNGADRAPAQDEPRHGLALLLDCVPKSLPYILICRAQRLRSGPSLPIGSSLGFHNGVRVVGPDKHLKHRSLAVAARPGVPLRSDSHESITFVSRTPSPPARCGSATVGRE